VAPLRECEQHEQLLPCERGRVCDLRLRLLFAWLRAGLYMAFMGYAVMWYYVAAAVVVGFAVAYAAMFGFDKLKEALGQIKKNNE